jgi:16S rRNA processing protein RimM
LEDSYLYDEIIGLSVVTTGDEVIGEIDSIIKTGANDVYFVKKPDGSMVLIPAIKQVVKEIDIKAGKMLIEPLPGLLEL